MALCSTTHVKSHLSISSSGHDTLLAQLISQVESMIERETGIKTDAASYVSISNEIRDSEGTLVLKTKFKPIRTLTKIEYRETDNTWTTYADETIGNVVFHEDLNEIYPLYVMIGAGKRNIRISYTCGYKTAEVPSDLNLCAVLLVATLFNQRNSVGVANQSCLGLTQSMATEDALFVKKVLTKYKNVIVL